LIQLKFHWFLGIINPWKIYSKGSYTLIGIDVYIYIIYRGNRGRGHNGHRGTKSRPNCQWTYWLRVV